MWMLNIYWAMLIQSDLNQFQLREMETFERFYLNALPIRPLKRPNKYYNKYKNQFFPNNSHIHIRVSDSVSSYHFPFPVIGSKFQNWTKFLFVVMNVI